MKPYFVLLVLLYCSTVLKSILHLRYVADLSYGILWAAIIPVFVLGLWACYGLAFSKKYMNADFWRLVWQATLGLGIYAIFLMTYGVRLGVTEIVQVQGFFLLLLECLPFVLFAIPVVQYERKLRKGALNDG